MDLSQRNLLTVTKDENERAEFYIRRDDKKSRYFTTTYYLREGAPKQAVNRHARNKFQANNVKAANYTLRHAERAKDSLSTDLWKMEYCFIKPAKRWRLNHNKYLGFGDDLVVRLLPESQRAYFKLEEVPLQGML